MSYGNRSGNRYGGGRSGGYGGGGDRFGGSSMGGPKPVEVGKQYNVDVTELSRRGDGIAKIQGFVVFVKGSRVGDKVRIKVETVGPRFATASVVTGEAATTDTGTTSESQSSESSGSSMTESV